jgi:hypothetical protein
MASALLAVSISRKIWIGVACLALSLWLEAPAALAQHGGGHAGGGHFGGGGHLGGGHVGGAPRAGAGAAPRVASPRSAPARFSGPRFSRLTPPVLGAGVTDINFRRRPIHPRPIVPIVPVPVFWGGPFFGFGWGYGFNSLWWPGCDPLWRWGFGCNGYAYYGPYYGFGYGGFGYGLETYVSPPPYVTPQYAYGGGERQLVRLYLKDGSVYSVTDYWLVDDELHFTMFDETAAKSVERVIGFDELDLQRTTDVNTRQGFRFVLRNEPLQRYMERHRDSAQQPAEAPPQNN